MPSNGRLMISLRPEAKQALMRLAVLLTPVVGKPANYGDAILTAEKICRDALARESAGEQR